MTYPMAKSDKQPYSRYAKRGTWGVGMVQKIKASTSDPKQRTDDAGLAEKLLNLVRADWLEGTWSAEAKRFVPSLLLGVYVADQQGRRLSKREACTIMNADPATSGPKYIKLAEERGLIEIERRPAKDRRKDFLSPTPHLNEIINRELYHIAYGLGVVASEKPTDNQREVEGKRPARRNSPKAETVELRHLREKPKRASAKLHARDLDKLNERIERNPTDTAAYLKRANLYCVMGKRVGVDRDGQAYYGAMLRSAIADCSKVISLEPTCSGAYLLRAASRTQLQEHKSALEDLNKAIELAPANPIAYAQRASVYRHTGDIMAAMRDLDHAITVDQSNSELFRTRALLRAINGDFDGAIKDYTEAIQADPSDPYGYIDRGWAYEASGNVALAEADYLEFKKSRSSNLFRADISRGALYADLGDREKALANFNCALHDPDIEVASNRRDLMYVRERIRQLEEK